MQKFSDEPVKMTDGHEKVNLRYTAISVTKTINPAKNKIFGTGNSRRARV